MFSHTGAKITASLKKRTEVTGNSIFFPLEGGGIEREAVKNH